jgi:hypothetical protein
MDPKVGSSSTLLGHKTVLLNLIVLEIQGEARGELCPRHKIIFLIIIFGAPRSQPLLRKW